jgi:heme-degrading monooxygenase HmoA
MPHFHLHLHNVHLDASDEEGMELADLAAARAKALEGIRGFLGHEVMTGKMDLRGQVDIADDAGVILLTVRFDEAVVIMRAP